MQGCAADMWILDSIRWDLEVFQMVEEEGKGYVESLKD
jgi:hypothetical protein